ncbi:MAG: hypothetical protein IH944_09015 [Armatimonadetes bacterium]|nr:hypothetical protein [Armatimonadota bacterium]
MKLNLVPSHVKEAQGALVFMLIGGVIAAVAVAISFMLIANGRAALDKANARVDAVVDDVGRVMGKAEKADEIILLATGIDRNIKLAHAMSEHSAKYPALFKDVMDHIPSFYRISSLSATPTSAASCTVTMSGVLQTHQQYADLVAALYKMEGVTSVARGGFVSTAKIVPTLTELDQIGTAVGPGQPNLSSDWEARMDEQIQLAASEPQGFLNVGGFGAPGPGMKGAMPGWSTVTITMSISRPMQTPDPRATVNQHGSGGGAGAAGALPGFAGAR